MSYFGRGLLLAATVSLALVGSGCSSDVAADPAATRRQPAPTATVPAPGVVAIGIVTKMDGTSVSWTDGHIRSSETNNQVIEALPGAEHQHSAPLAADATFFVATTCGSSGDTKAEAGAGDTKVEVKVDVKGLGTVPCTAAQFREQVVNNANVAPAITLDEKGRIIRMAARYHP